MADLQFPQSGDTNWAGLGGTPGAKLNDALNALKSLPDRVSRLRIDVKDHGAIGDGVADDRSAVQSALDAAAAAGGAVVFFPVGTYRITITAGNALTIPGKGIRLQGVNREKSIIKLADSQGDYVSMLTNGSNDVTGLEIRDLTFNQNASNNVIVSTVALLSGQPRYILRCFLGTDITVENCRFTDADNVNTLSFNAASGVARISVRNNLFDNHGAQSPSHDHSTLYFSCDGMRVEGNAFIGAGVSARTAIETHGPSQQVTGNTVKDFFKGMNLTGVAGASSRQVVCSGNTLIGVGVGIHLWALVTGGSTFGLEDVVVQGNVIDISLDAWTSQAAYKSGILFDPAADLGFMNILVSENIIRYAPFTTVPTSTDLGSSGISFRRTNNYAGEDRGITIVDNRVVNPPSAGMFFDLRSTARSLHIKRNVIRNPRTGASVNIPAAYATGVMIQGLSGNGTYADLQVTDNTVVDDRTPHLLNSAIDTQFVTTTITAALERDTVMFLLDGGTASAILKGSVKWSRGISAETNLFTSTRYYTAPVPTRSTLAMVNGTLYAFPFWCGVDQNFDRMGMTVTAGIASTLIRLGAYADNGNGSPGDLLFEAGTLDGSSATSQEITFSPAKGLPQGCSWLVAVAQGGGPTVRSGSGPLMPMGGGSLATVTGAGGGFAGVIATPVAGALPSTFPAVANYVVPVPLIALRAAV